MCKTELTTRGHDYNVMSVGTNVRIVSIGGEMDNFYTVQDLAERLKVHKNTIFAHIKSGRLPAVKVGTALSPKG